MGGRGGSGGGWGAEGGVSGVRNGAHAGAPGRAEGLDAYAKRGDVLVRAPEIRVGRRPA